MDSVSNFLNKLSIASKTGKESFTFPLSRLVSDIGTVLEKQGYVSGIARKGKRGRYLEVTLAYTDRQPAVKGVRRISKQSKRVYFGVRELRPVRSGFGMRILSTPKGVLADKEARALRVGGEVLFEIW
ncbi:MAG: 30S ribosomal protein S8 [bacterium]|nr:30S ribosomal protein S8 [bacterium]